MEPISRQEQMQELGIWVLGYAGGAAALVLISTWSQTVGYANWEGYATGFIHAAWYVSTNFAFLSVLLSSLLLFIGGIGLCSTGRWGAVPGIFGIAGNSIACVLNILADFLASFHGVIERDRYGNMRELPWSVSENLRVFLFSRFPPLLIVALVVIGAGVLLIKKFMDNSDI